MVSMYLSKPYATASMWHKVNIVFLSNKVALNSEFYFSQTCLTIYLWVGERTDGFMPLQKCINAKNFIWDSISNDDNRYTKSTSRL